MLSILSPTRNRPNEIRRLVRSILETADSPDHVELILYIDNDDRSYDDLLKEDLGVSIRHTQGPRIIVSDMWNKCYDIATGPLYQFASDDFVFRTKGWDSVVASYFEASHDKIMLLYGRDGHQDENLATLGFLHKNWIETVGYLMPPYFQVDWCDTWINHVAVALGRRIYAPEIYTEHLHWCAGKSAMDLTYSERHALRLRDDGGYSLFLALEDKRFEDIHKLREFIDSCG